MTEIVEVKAAAQNGPLKGLLKTFLRKPLGVASAAFLLIVILGSVFAEQLAPMDPLEQSLLSIQEGPSLAHLLGTDALGRDVLSRLMYGGRDSLTGVLQALVFALAIGIPFGVATGYIGGMFDRVSMRLIDFKMAIPGIIVTLAVLAIFNNSMTAAMITFGILASGTIIRVLRSTVLGVREELYIDAAAVIGLSETQIIVRHILPRTVGVIIVQTSMLAAIALGVQTGLAFLSFGPPPPAPTWGGMVAEAASLMRQHLWLLVPTSGLIALTTLALGLLGDAVRDTNAERLTRPSSVRTRSRGRQSATTLSDQIPDCSALLSVRDLTVSFENDRAATVVLEAVTLDIQPGESVGLVGESGSGKTVTALAILGLLASGGQIISGSVWYDGKNITHYNADQYRALRGKEIAMISQEPMVALDPAFRVGWQIAEVVRTHESCNRSEARNRVLDLLRAVKIPDPEKVARLYPHQISGGMAQRIAIAMALAGNPRLLIADEPTTALDVTVQAEILDLLRGLQAEKKMAMLFVTHDWAVVADICSKAIVMYAGQVVEQASVREMFDQPLHPYTKGLLESSPHLAVKGQPLPTIGGVVPPPGSWPQGCHFAPRCPFATEACSMHPIVEESIAPDRTSRCIHVNELLVGNQ